MEKVGLREKQSVIRVHVITAQCQIAVLTHEVVHREGRVFGKGVHFDN